MHDTCMNATAYCNLILSIGGRISIVTTSTAIDGEEATPFDGMIVVKWNIFSRMRGGGNVPLVLLQQSLGGSIG